MACSNGINGLTTLWGYETIKPLFPYVTAASFATWNSPMCGSCVYIQDQTTKNGAYVTVIDQCQPAELTPGATVSGTHFDMSPISYMKVFGDAGMFHGHGTADWYFAKSSCCNGNKGLVSPNNCVAK